MSSFRRVVTGHRADGKSVIASDGPVTGTQVPGMPGTVLTTLWGSDEAFRYPDDGSEQSHAAWFPPLGGVRFIAFTLPPDRAAVPGAVDANDVEAAERLFPGLLAHFTDEAPGMHRSATIDMLYVATGRCVLELDDGSATELAAGDMLIQSGTMHRWKNPWDEPCQIIGVVNGARVRR